MRKIYSMLLMMVMAIGISFQAKAALTIKVNKIGIATFSGNGVETRLDQEINVIEPNQGDMVIGEISLREGYIMTCKNETTGATVPVDGGTKINVNPAPGNPQNGHTINITIIEASQNVTFLFDPEGCAYVVTAHTEYSGYNPILVEDKTYNTPNGDGEIVVPYQEGTYLIKPNPGYSLTKALNEAEINPHYTGDLPNGDGIISISSGSFKAGAQFVVTASKAGSFTVRGEGNNVDNIAMQNLKTYDFVEVTKEFKEIPCDGSVTYSIRSNSSAPLWKVQVTNNGDTDYLEGSSGYFEYKPNDGDEVVIWTDRPETHAKLKISYEGEGVNKNLISSVTYSNNEVSEGYWSSEDGWDVIAGGSMTIKINPTGFVNLACSVNNVAQSISSSYDGKKQVSFMIENDDEHSIKDYNIVISARKEKVYSVKLVCENPQAVIVNNNAGTISFTSSPQTISLPESDSQIHIAANSGWLVDGILVDNVAPESDKFVYGWYQVLDDCTITINVTDLAAKRNKTAVVYVDEDVTWAYLNLQYQDQTSVSLKSGYQEIKFCDDDLPFSLGSYSTSGSSVFYVNGVVSTVNPSPETISLEDGAVIKYFAGTPAQQVVTYNIADDVADLVEIYHDYYTSVDHKAEKQYFCFKGTLIHIKPAAQSAALRTRAAEAPFQVAVDGTKLTPDADGVYTVKVGDSAPSIVVAKDIQSGVEENLADDSEVFDIINLQGAVVKRNATIEDLNALPAGIYIVGGRKVVVK